MGDDEDRARIGAQVAFEPVDGLGVEMVGRLVEQQEVGLLQQQAAERDAPPFAARKLGHIGIVRRAAERVHRLLDLALEVPQALGLDLVLERRHLVSGLVGIVHCELVVAVEDRLLLLHAQHGVALDVERGVEVGLLRQVADFCALGDEALADEFGVEPRHDAHKRRLARAVDAEHADFRVRVERQVDVVENLLAGRIGLGETSHMIDELARGHEKFLNCSEIAAGISGQGRRGKAAFARRTSSRSAFQPAQLACPSSIHTVMPGSSFGVGPIGSARKRKLLRSWSPTARAARQTANSPSGLSSVTLASKRSPAAVRSGDF